MKILGPLISGKTPGIVGKIYVEENTQVESGDLLVQIETGKENRSIKAPEKGIIKKIFIKEGDQIKTNQLLFELEEIEISIKKTDFEKKEKKLTTEIVIIGGGPGGYVAALFAAKNNMQVTIIEKNKLGGTCLNVGCIPTKSLISSAEFFQNIKKAEEFGITVNSEIVPDFKKMIDRKNKVVETLSKGIYYLFEKNDINFINGEAKFINNDKIQVETETEIININAKNIIIATGSKISVPPIKGIEKRRIINSTDALNLKTLPKSLTIIGGGVIGLEFAFIYNSLGVEVNVIEAASTILSTLDTDVIDEITSIAKKRGITFFTNALVKEIKETTKQEGVTIFEQHGMEKIVISEKILVAIGREPNTDSLALDKTDIKIEKNKKRIITTNEMKTNIPNIYAIGDVTSKIQLAHIASHQGIIAIKNIIGQEAYFSEKAIPSVVFTSPEIATIGLNEKQCQEKGYDYRISKFNYRNNGKALSSGHSEGFIKLIEDIHTKKILGSTIIGDSASSLISTIAIIINKDLTAKEIEHLIFAHPTVAEIIPEAFMELDLGALHQ